MRARYTSPRTMRRIWFPVVALSLAPGCVSQSGSAPSPAPNPATPATVREATPAERAETDEYTRYELLAPETAQFHILYEVTAIAPGAKVFFNPIRKGSEASGERAIDRMSGEALKFEVVSGEEARRTGLPKADLDTEYIRIRLPRPVPADGGQVRLPPVKKGQSIRLRISETYTDPKSYRLEGDELVFDRSFGRPRNAVVLPAGWYLTACAIPATVSQTPDGRLRLDFVNPRPDEIAVLIKAKRRRGTSG